MLSGFDSSRLIRYLLVVLCLGHLSTCFAFVSPLLVAKKMGNQSPSSESSPLISEMEKSNEVDIRAKIASARALMQQTHDSRVSFSYEWRKEQLTKLRDMVQDNAGEIEEALYQDLGKHPGEAALAEMMNFRGEMKYFLANTHRLMQPQDRPSVGAIAPAFAKVTPMPRNGPAVLVIGPYNYPIAIPLMAVAGSLAAGNPTILKPSEMCPACATLLSRLIKKYFDPSAVQVIEGGVEETTALLEQEWGLIHFTGSERVGKIVAAAAAKTLTPYVLELGGKCPVLVDETSPSDMSVVGSRIIWAKFLNCGQNCISPDYLLVHQSKLDALLPELKKSLEAMFGANPKESSLGRLVAENHVERAVQLMEEIEKLAKEDKKIQIVGGGSQACDVKAKYIAPTFILNPPLDSRLMQEELFSPILPIIPVQSREEAINVINKRPGTPLSLTVFTSNQDVFKEVIERCRSGSAIRNDFMIQFSGPFMPFGGLGSSGSGAYRGEKSFETFSHMLSTVERPAIAGTDLNQLRCHPYPAWKQVMLRKVAPILPDIPVMKNLKRAVVVGLVAVGISRFVPGADGFRTAIAGVLEKAASAISP